jgi:hypothetical protein
MKNSVFIALRRYPVVSKRFQTHTDSRTLSYMMDIVHRLSVYHKVTLLTHSLSDSKSTMLDPSKRRKICVSSELECVDGSETVKTWYFAGIEVAYS